MRLSTKGRYAVMAMVDLWEELGNQIHMYLSSITVEDVVNRRVLGSSHLFSPGQGVTVAAE
jgi:Rrf2 family iron-sulfur cluster assembly transcriptional regulator